MQKRRDPIGDTYGGRTVVVLGAGAYAGAGLPLYRDMTATIAAKEPRARALEKAERGRAMQAVLQKRRAENMVTPAILGWCNSRLAEGRDVSIVTMNVCGTVGCFRGDTIEVHGNTREQRCCLCDLGSCACGEEYRSPAVRWDGESLPLEMNAIGRAHV